MPLSATFSDIDIVVNIFSDE